MRSLIPRPNLAPDRALMERVLQAPPDRSPAPLADVLGVSQGSTSYGSDSKSSMDLIGLTANESPEMQPPMRFSTFDIMSREDAAVKSSMMLYNLPIRSAQFTVLPAGNGKDPVDRLIAASVEWNFGLGDYPGVMDLTWHEQLSQALLSLRYGCMFEEILVGDVDVWYDADGDPHPMRPITRLMPRFPQSIRWPDGIITDQKLGTIGSLTQHVPGARTIPGDKLCWYVHEREGTDWLGTAMIRPMYGPWRLKRAVLISAGIGWDRFAFGTPVIRYPKSSGQAHKSEAEAIGRNWRTHERGYFVLEGTALEGWDIDVKGAGNMEDPTPLIHTYDEQMAAAALEHFVVLGRTATGSRAVGDALSEPYYLALQATADDIMRQKERRILRRFVDMNWGRQYDVPKIDVSKLQARNVAVLAAAIAGLADAGLSFDDPDTQDDLRDMLDLRHLPEAIRAKLEAALAEDVGVTQTEPRPTTGAAVIPSQRVPTSQQDGNGNRAAFREGDTLYA